MIEFASKQAEKSLHKYRLGAVIVKSGRILASGFNESNRYSKVIKTKREFIDNIHAEQSAIAKLLSKNKLDDLIGSTLFVSRIMSNGTTGLSKPCAECELLIKSVGIKNVIYTTSKGTVKWKV